VINAGSITGGNNGGNNGSGSNGQANAINFSGGGNTLEIYSTSQIMNNVVSASGSTNGGDTLELGGTTSGTFAASNIGASAQYQGFTNYVKTGVSTWTLTGVTTAVTPWTINNGALNVTGSTVNSTITTAGGGTLEGTGTVGNVNVNPGGKLSPGNANTSLAPTLAASTSNSLTSASLTFNGAVAGGGSTLQYNLNNNTSGSSTALNPAGGTVDVVTGTFSGVAVSSTNQIILDFNGSMVGGDNVYNLVEYASTTFTSTDTSDFLIEDLNLTSGDTDSLVFNSTVDALQLVIAPAAVPEPSSWKLMLCFMALFALLRQRAPQTGFGTTSQKKGTGNFSGPRQVGSGPIAAFVRFLRVGL
jgi:fibronectin-binding autotransporter adhesin